MTQKHQHTTIDNKNSYITVECNEKKKKESIRKILQYENRDRDKEREDDWRKSDHNNTLDSATDMFEAYRN